jgi:hypothetical protein
MTPLIRPAIPKRAKLFSGKYTLTPIVLRKCENTNPEIQPKKRLGAKIPPHPPPAFVAVVANTLKSSTRARYTSSMRE